MNWNQIRYQIIPSGVLIRNIYGKKKYLMALLGPMYPRVNTIKSISLPSGIMYQYKCELGILIVSRLLCCINFS